MLRTLIAGFALQTILLRSMAAPAQQPPADSLQKYFQEGETALSEGRYTDAELAYKKIAQLDPRKAEVHARLGMIHFQSGKYEEAIPELRRALVLKPLLEDAATLLAMSQSELGKYKEALPGLEKGFKRSSGSLKRLAGLQLQRAYTEQQLDDKAVAVALDLTREYPDDPEILYHAGRVFGNYAFVTMMKLSKAPASSVWRHQAAGEAFESQGSYDLAIVEYRTVLTLDPRRPGIHYRIGRGLLSQSQKLDAPPALAAEAAGEFQLELERDPTNANAAYELGEMRRKAGDFEPARGYFEAAVKQDGEFEEAQVGLARTLIALHKPDMALAHLQKAVALNPSRVTSFYHLARVEGALGHATEQQKALAEYRRLTDQVGERESRELQPSRDVTQPTLDANSDQ